MIAAGRQLRHHRFGFAAGGEVAVAIRKADHRTGVGDVDPFGIRAGRIERNAEMCGKARRVHFAARLARVRGPQYANAAGTAFRHEDVAIGCGANEARLIKPLGKQADFEARRHQRLCACGAIDNPHTVRVRGPEVRGRQVLGPYMPAQSRPVGVPVGERRAALEKLTRALGQCGRQKTSCHEQRAAHGRERREAHDIVHHRSPPEPLPMQDSRIMARRFCSLLQSKSAVADFDQLLRAETRVHAGFGCGRGRGGVGRFRHVSAPIIDPTPDPSPQRGRGEEELNPKYGCPGRPNGPALPH